MRKSIIAGNWKMYKTNQEALALVEGLKKALDQDICKRVEVVVCPPAVALGSVKKTLEGSQIGVGAQNIFWENEGAYTGEISGVMLKSIGVSYCIIGHSERRTIFKETNEMVNKKVKKALELGLIPIMCVGETLQEREQQKTMQVIADHVKNGLIGVAASDAQKVVIAYEPVWAIGTGRNATGEQAQEVHAYIRTLLTEMYGANVANTIRIQYGGSVKPENAVELLGKKDIDGALVGGASLKVDTFAAIVKAVQEKKGY